ncbi:DUF1456 family protein [Luteolibacter sp. AS25]|uniref:DUF1456 family protein n=1 Tax=Luteolibacter sp. AS25 TaxID=3135776 RepID=UPI00398B22D2
MTNNDILRRLRYAFHYPDVKMAQIIAHTGVEVTPEQVKCWLLKDAEEGYQEISDTDLCRFLDGLIIEKRGNRPDGMVPEPLKFLSTNESLKKLRIALELREEEMLEVFERVEFVVTKAELGSFFRKQGHRNFAKCPEQVLRKFIQGLAKAREEAE